MKAVCLLELGLVVKPPLPHVQEHDDDGDEPADTHQAQTGDHDVLAGEDYQLGVPLQKE